MLNAKTGLAIWHTGHFPGGLTCLLSHQNICFFLNRPIVFFLDTCWNVLAEIFIYISKPLSGLWAKCLNLTAHLQKQNAKSYCRWGCHTLIMHQGDWLTGPAVGYYICQPLSPSQLLSVHIILTLPFPSLLSGDITLINSGAEQAGPIKRKNVKVWWKAERGEVGAEPNVLK